MHKYKKSRIAELHNTQSEDTQIIFRILGACYPGERHSSPATGSGGGGGGGGGGGAGGGSGRGRGRGRYRITPRGQVSRLAALNRIHHRSVARSRRN